MGEPTLNSVQELATDEMLVVDGKLKPYVIARMMCTGMGEAYVTLVN